jgi:two-component system LytT family response regulator
MTKITTIIVEDSRLARNELRELIKQHPEIDVVAEAENADTAYELIVSLQPQLIFLDINMPGKDGFQLLEMLDEVPMVVFTTAFDEYAIRSFEFNALDYLLKPINEKRFADAVEKVKSKLTQPLPDVILNSGVLSENSQIFIKDGEKCWLVRVTDIQLCEIVGNYTRVHFNGNKPLIYKSLNQVEERLPQHIFFRANRQQVINLQYIQSVDNALSGKLAALMQNGVEVEISRRQSVLFKDMLSL